MNHATHKGFSLIELLVIIMLLSVSSVALVGMFGEVANNIDINHDINAASQMAQECGEYLLSLRREYGYGMNGIGDCTATGAFNGYGPPTVNIDAAYAGDGSNGCPLGQTCTHINVDATNNSGGATLDFIVVNY